MALSLSPQSLAAVTARLRASGCVFAEDETRLLAAAARTPADLDAMVGRRAAGLPLEQVIGSAEFCGLRIAVEPGVFVPRRRTEFLVRQAAALAAETAGARTGTPVVVDLCCGSGALGAALAAFLGGQAELHAADIDPAAVRCARRNLASLGGHVYEGDLYGPLPAALRGRVCVLLANVPYIPAGEIAMLPPEARDHEPRVALDGGPDGLDVLRRVAEAAPDWLAPAGVLLVETSQDQARVALGIMARAGLTAWVAQCDDLDATVVIGSALAEAPPG
jgi:release factor glutamine methyltransferase